MNENPNADPNAPHRAIVTPEGIPLFFSIAQSGDRLGAFLLDLTVLYGSVILFALLTIAALDEDGGWFLAFFLFVSFIIRNGYFIFFELRWRGSTPGKRKLGLQVVDARGGPLKPHSVIVRNLTRDLEVFLPLQLLLAPDAVWPGAPRWAALASTLWLLVFALLPAFNKERLRVGDLLAGTRVVVSPKAMLLEDIGDQRGGWIKGPGHTFTAEHLSHYGEYELSVLEQVIRQGVDVDPLTVEEVRRKICKRIGWKTPVKDSMGFLRDFYAAQRAQLERGMLFGERLADKTAARQRARTKKGPPGSGRSGS
ncbi:MAG: RDD family protein [Bradymonadia bacterium]